MSNKYMNRFSKFSQPGFTLIEMVIAIGVIAIISTVSIVVINPTEVFKKTRDGQRISDLAALDRALTTYISSTENPSLGGPKCLDGVIGTVTANIMYSVSRPSVPLCSANITEGSDVDLGNGTEFDTSVFCAYFTVTNYRFTNGNGWIPVNFDSIPGGSPFSQLPIDPTNSIASPIAPNSADLAYRYACQEKTVSGDGAPPFVYELNAVLESDAYRTIEDKSALDGGDNTNYYEVGTSKRLIGTGTNF